jgi:cytochrome-b5 reductase
MEFVTPAKRLHLLHFQVNLTQLCIANPLRCQARLLRAKNGSCRVFSSISHHREEQHQQVLPHKPSPKHNLKAPQPAAKTRLLIFGSLGLLASAILYTQTRNSSQSGIFDPPRFTPFTITKRENVSPTSILIVIRPSIPSSLITPDPFGTSWQRGPWSVEIKQPELQIARSYTPLPPNADDEPGDLRFLIRKEHKGEMSGYLWNLKEGDGVWLRGPKQEYELGEGISDVVFVAGGTGIAPALQVAYTLLERRNGKQIPNIRIIWANRRREDCIGGGEGAKTLKDRKEIGPIIQLIEELQSRHPESLKMTYLIDEVGTYIDQKKVSAALKQNVGVKSQPIISRIDSKILFVSGPEGFVDFVAGSKRWEGGKEVQGQLGGLLGRMGIRDWKIWKL